MSLLSTEVVEGVVAGSTVPPGCVLALSQVAGADGVTATTLRVFGESGKYSRLCALTYVPWSMSS